MPEQSKTARIVSVVVGLVLVIAAVCWVIFGGGSAAPPPDPTVVRPLKTYAIGAPVSAAGGSYPGQVQANEQVQLAFQVSGQLVEFPIRKGQEVPEGTLLGRLDPRDFENDLAAKKALLDKAESEYERIQMLFERDAANPKELSDAKSVYEAALAETSIARKALDDASLLAPFAGVIANTYVDNFQNVSKAEPVLSLQEVGQIEVVVNVPERRVVMLKGGEDHLRFVATFEYLPGREFEVKLKEYATEADAATQTFAVTFAMPTPDDARILPGMTATIREYALGTGAAEKMAHLVPIEAVPNDEATGEPFVWLIKDAGRGEATVKRTNVTVGEMVRGDILVMTGVSQGDRIAAAGVHLLQEDQRVKPFTAIGDDTQ